MYFPTYKNSLVSPTYTFPNTNFTINFIEILSSQNLNILNNNINRLSQYYSIAATDSSYTVLNKVTSIIYNRSFNDQLSTNLNLFKKSYIEYQYYNDSTVGYNYNRVNIPNIFFMGSSTNYYLIKYSTDGIN